MNPEIKKKWVDTLNNGGYKQGINFLHTQKNGEHMFCCLGVLCDIYIKENPDKTWVFNLDGKGGDDGFYKIDNCSRMLPSEVITWAEIDVEQRVAMEKKINKS